MLIVALMLPKSVGKTQALYDAHPLAPAVITENVGTTLTLTTLVNMNASDCGPAHWALTSRVVKRIPNTHDTVGTKVPVVAVGGQRSTRDKNTWQVITPMPIAWAPGHQGGFARTRRDPSGPGTAPGKGPQGRRARHCCEELACRALVRSLAFFDGGPGGAWRVLAI